MVRRSFDPLLHLEQKKTWIWKEMVWILMETESMVLPLPLVHCPYHHVPAIVAPNFVDKHGSILKLILIVASLIIQKVIWWSMMRKMLLPHGPARCLSIRSSLLLRAKTQNRQLPPPFHQHRHWSIESRDRISRILERVVSKTLQYPTPDSRRLDRHVG